MKVWILGMWLLAPIIAVAQVESDTTLTKKQIKDAQFIDEIENIVGEKDKVLHAEPLYIDLIRDLGARKGEKEWNFAGGLKAGSSYNEYEALVEYEWAPIDRLGFEVELPLTLYGQIDEKAISKRPSNRLESIKMATQWSFLVSDKWNTSMAFGYIHQFEMHDLNKLSFDHVFKGNVFNPFFIAAKRWGSNFHSLIYTGPSLVKEFGNQDWKKSYEINSSFHYMITGTKNFIGVEVNQHVERGKWTTTMRPQMRLAIAENLMVGIVTGIPIYQTERGLSSFLRIIYEPNFKALH